MSRILNRRRVLVLLALGVLAVLGVLASNYRSFISSYVTKKALRAAQRATPISDKEFENLRDEIREEFGSWFEEHYVDRAIILRAFPTEGVVEEAWPPLIVYLAHVESLWASRPPEQSEEELAFEEYVACLDPFVANPKGLEILVNVLIADHEIFESESDGSFAKMVLGTMLFSCEKDSDLDIVDFEKEAFEWKARCVEVVEERHWNSLRVSMRHPRERVRVGAILLARFHPSREVFVQDATRALRDPSSLVRLAAAGSLALIGESTGRIELIMGTASERWEIRWWSGACLAVLGAEVNLLPLGLAAAIETDPWVRRELEKGYRLVVKAFGEKRAPVVPPDRAALGVLRASLPGWLASKVPDRLRLLVTRRQGLWFLWAVRSFF